VARFEDNTVTKPLHLVVKTCFCTKPLLVKVLIYAYQQFLGKVYYANLERAKLEAVV